MWVAYVPHRGKSGLDVVLLHQNAKVQEIRQILRSLDGILLDGV